MWVLNILVDARLEDILLAPAPYIEDLAKKITSAQ